MNNLEFDLPKEKSSIIKVIGVGGAGSNALNHMYQKGIKGVNFIIANTDDQHLNMSPIKAKILLGPELTKGLGTGADPEIGKRATEESIAQIKEELGHGTRMLFIAAGMGKGTGTGGSPVVARIAREMGILTVAIVTTPFSMLGKSAVKKAEEGIERLKENVDALIVVANDQILSIYGKLKGSEAFAMADDILANAAKGIAEIITGAGIHNTDFNDVRSVLLDGGMTIMGIGHARGESRAKDAVMNALKSPLLSDYDITGAQKALVNISYSEEFECTMDEIGEIIEAVNESAQNDIEIIHGTSVDNTLEDEIAVTIVVTGFNKEKNLKKDVQEVKKEIISMDKAAQNLHEETNEIIVVENEKQILIDFGTPVMHGENLSFDESSYFQNDTSQAHDDISISISDAEETTFVDQMGRFVEETDEEKRRRMLSKISFDINSPLKSTDHLELGIETISDKSKTLITDNLNLFKDNNKFNTNLD
ncbi:MAG: cell division protein FtsZ [Chitinophagales bacterium]|jgi:cell division protein FtsZ|nr:cell division protein FtsZ [Sphingobacteriales bacterium]